MNHKFYLFLVLLVSQVKEFIEWGMLRRGVILRMCESGASYFVYTTVRSDNTLPGRWGATLVRRWVAKLVERWVAKLVAHLLATTALWVHKQREWQTHTKKYIQREYTFPYPHQLKTVSTMKKCPLGVLDSL